MEVKEIEIKAIRNEADYKNALHIIDTLLNCEPESKEENALEVISILVDKYEKTNHPINDPDPIDKLKYCIEHTTISVKDLTKFVGGRVRLSEILDRKRPLTLKMIKNLHTHLHIPASLLLAS
jgi:HTH-type transcriptional regulator/antitoxin HigA